MALMSRGCAEAPGRRRCGRRVPQVPGTRLPGRLAPWPQPQDTRWGAGRWQQLQLRCAGRAAHSCTRPLLAGRRGCFRDAALGAHGSPTTRAPKPRCRLQRQARTGARSSTAGPKPAMTRMRRMSAACSSWLACALCPKRCVSAYLGNKGLPARWEGTVGLAGGGAIGPRVVCACEGPRGRDGGNNTAQHEAPPNQYPSGKLGPDGAHRGPTTPHLPHNCQQTQ